MDCTIREIRYEDNGIIELIIRNCLIEFNGNRAGTAWEDPDLGRFSEIYNTATEKYWVAETDRVVGGVGIAPLAGADGVCELQKMYCIPEVRSTGISHKLIETALNYAKQYFDKCYLETFDNMIAAQKFYEKYGFVRIDEPLGNTGHYACDVRYIKHFK